jgi:hypothetical protein
MKQCFRNSFRIESRRVISADLRNLPKRVWAPGGLTEFLRSLLSSSGAHGLHWLGSVCAPQGRNILCCAAGERNIIWCVMICASKLDALWFAPLKLIRYDLRPSGLIRYELRPSGRVFFQRWLAKRSLPHGLTINGRTQDYRRGQLQPKACIFLVESVIRLHSNFRLLLLILRSVNYTCVYSQL